MGGLVKVCLNALKRKANITRTKNQTTREGTFSWKEIYLRMCTFKMKQY